MTRSKDRTCQRCNGGLPCVWAATRGTAEWRRAATAEGRGLHPIDAMTAEPPIRPERLTRAKEAAVTTVEHYRRTTRPGAGEAATTTRSRSSAASTAS